MSIFAPLMYFVLGSVVFAALLFLVKVADEVLLWEDLFHWCKKQATTCWLHVRKRPFSNALWSYCALSIVVGTFYMGQHIRMDVPMGSPDFFMPAILTSMMLVMVVLMGVNIVRGETIATYVKTR